MLSATLGRSVRALHATTGHSVRALHATTGRSVRALHATTGRVAVARFAPALGLTTEQTTQVRCVSMKPRLSD